MPMTLSPLVRALLCCLLLPSIVTAQDAPAPAEVTNPPLAERLAAAAQDQMRRPNAEQATWRAGVALLRAATRLAPAEPRFSRLLAEAVARTGDDQATIDALTAYRKLAPTDQS